MPIHEESLIRPEDLRKHEELSIDDVDVSGHWSTFIESRVVSEYNENLEREIAAFPGGAYIHRCWQCGACTNSCTVNAINPDFNPRYWIYLARLGMEQELLRDKDIIWQCVSCHRCTHVCPRDVEPEGVMKALSHWLEAKGHTPKSHSQHFDEEFYQQILETGKIEEGRIVRKFFNRTSQPLMQSWLIQMAKNLIRGLPIMLMFKMGLSTLFRPKTRDWSKSRHSIEELIEMREAERKNILEGNETS